MVLKHRLHFRNTTTHTLIHCFTLSCLLFGSWAAAYFPGQVLSAVKQEIKGRGARSFMPNPASSVSQRLCVFGCCQHTNLGAVFSICLTLFWESYAAISMTCNILYLIFFFFSWRGAGQNEQADKTYSFAIP